MKKISREEAKKKGLKHYYTKPCIHGHTCGRFVTNGNCITCHAQSQQRWLDKGNRDSWNEYQKQVWRQKHNVSPSKYRTRDKVKKLINDNEETNNEKTNHNS